MMRRCAVSSATLQSTGGMFLSAQALRCSSFSQVGTPHAQAPNAFHRFRSLNGAVQADSSFIHSQCRSFLFRAKNTEPAKIKVDETVFDKQHSHWGGELFGIPMDKVIYYLKINGGMAAVVLVVYFFFKGYVWMSGFSLAAVGKMGFMAGFWTSAALYSMVLLVRRNYQIAPNAVYNQAIALVMKNQQVVDHLGSTPRTGDFRAYCASGGFKLPLLRRLRSGQYSVADAIGTKPRKLQMMFLLSSPTGGQEALVSCEVRKGTSGVISSNYYFQSLSLHLTCPKQEPKNVILIGGEKDIVFKGILCGALNVANKGDGTK